MSLKLKFGGSSDSGLLLRSRSFTGGHRRLSSAQSSLRSKPVAGKPRIPSWSIRSVWGQQPEQVDRIFQALKRGLNDYLEHHQTELDFLSSQQTQTKRSSRLGFIYDLEKEIRTVERHIRRLEFQISKVEELYESYCVQWRLCQGAVNMRKAFSLSPSSPESRQSLLELNRNYRHSQEDMCTMEGELEILLGELQIRMKGLIGFARLCPGDQYEVLIRLGRQRWRVRGRIQTDDSQMWDEEEMVFLPQIHGNFEIKVMEVRGLISVLVGMVSCRSADFFTARPQMMVVDITELGTIKLQLEVVWKPFDSSNVKPPSHSISSRKGSVYNWTPPNTPSFTEKYFLSMMRQLQDADEAFSIGSRKTRGVSLLSYLSDSTQGLGPPAYEKSSLPPLTPLTLLQEDHLLQTPPDAEESLEWLSQSDTASPSPVGSKRDPIFLFQRFSTPDILKQETTFIHQQEPRVAQTLASLLKDTDEALQEVSGVETKLKELNLQINKLRVLLKRNIGPHEAPSSQALAVEEEEVLGRFDFLSVDCNENETSGVDSVRKRGVGSVHQKLEPPCVLPQDDERQAVSFSTGLCSLDQALETHLSICMALVAALKHCESALVHDDITDELSRQIGVLKTIIALTQRRMDEVSVAMVLAGAPQGVEGLWRDCCSSDSQFCCSVEDFLKSLRKHFIHKVKAKHPGQADAVFNQLLHQMQCSGVMAFVSSCSTERVTVFQLRVYLQRWSILDFGQHVSLFSKEVYLIACLETPKRKQALQKLKGKRISDLQPTGRILQLLARLQMDTNHKVASAAMSCLKRASRSRYFRPKAVVHYTDLLRTGHTQVQREACLALKCLKASESAEQVAELWRSVDEDLRNIARETVLSFGKAGHSAFQSIDQIYEMDDDVYKNLETETTVF